MLQIDDKIISLDIIEKKFVCDLDKCKGACCIHGDSGAPLEEHEAKILDRDYTKIKPYLQQEAARVIEASGKHMVDADGDTVTPLIHGKECAYVFMDGGIAKCAIEKAYLNKKIKLRKPVSCHLYPLRIRKYLKFHALNYDEWEICKPALPNGERLNVPIYKFIKEALKRNYGNSFYKKLEIAADEINNSSKVKQ